MKRDYSAQEYVEKSEAQCAAMREVLEQIGALPWEAYSQQNGSAFGDGDWLRVKLQPGEEVLRRVRNILASDAGRDFLERLHKLEAVAEAARAFVDVFWKTYGDRPGCKGCFVGEIRDIEQALAALEESD